MDAVCLVDTTIHGLAHAVGASLTVDETLALVDSLAGMATDVIEVGAPARSADEFEAVLRVADLLAERCPGCTVAAVARCVPDDIARAAAALRPAVTARLHLLLPWSAQLVGGAGGRSGVGPTLDLVDRSVERARELVGDVQLSVRGEPLTGAWRLTDLAEVARDAGAGVLNICDPTGLALPQEFGGLVGELVNSVTELTYGVRCSNRLGLAAGNTLAGLAAGARQVSVSLDAAGIRSHACSYEDFVALLKVRGDELGVELMAGAESLKPPAAVVAELVRRVRARLPASGPGRRAAPADPAGFKHRLRVTEPPAAFGSQDTEVLRTVLRKLCDGVKDEAAARQMSVSVRTYRRHVAHLLRVLGASSRFEAGVKVAESGLLRRTHS